MELVCKIGVMKVYGLNVFSLLVFTAVNIFAAMLSKRGNETRSRALKMICAGLLSFNVCRYALAVLDGRGFIFPVEFSSVAYFAVPVIQLTGIRKAQSWAAYSGIMAGFFYYMTLILLGGRVYADYRPNDIYISLYCHGSLYLCGLVSLKTNRFEHSDRFLLLCGNVCVALNAFASPHSGRQGEDLHLRTDGRPVCEAAVPRIGLGIFDSALLFSYVRMHFAFHQAVLTDE
jgi:hypothetical protein